MKPQAPRIDMPEFADVGETILIRTKIRHVMETGWRKTSDGKTIDRNRLTKFSCSFENQEIISADLGSGVAQDPYFAFYAKVPRAGNFNFRWEGDDGQLVTDIVAIKIKQNS